MPVQIQNAPDRTLPPHLPLGKANGKKTAAVNGVQQGPSLAATELLPVSASTRENAKIYRSTIRNGDSFFTSAASLTRSRAYTRALIAPADSTAPGKAGKAPDLLGKVGGANKGSPLDPPSTGCQTCASRVYQDGSHDSGVSYQSAKGMPASSSGMLVAAHEGEHVSRETAEAQKEGKQITQKKVTIRMAFCPDCGRMYAAGGKTTIATRDTGNDQQHSVQIENADAAMGKAGEKMDRFL